MRLTNLISAATLLLLHSAAAGSAAAQCSPCNSGTVLISQLTDHSNGMASESGGLLPFVMAEQALLPATNVEDLTISVAGTFYHATNNNAPTNDFTLLIHQDNFGVPGAVVYSEVLVSASLTQTGNQVGGPFGSLVPLLDEYCLTITPTGPAALPAGTYWFEIFHNAANANVSQWVWLAAQPDFLSGTPQAARSITSAPGSSWYTNYFDLSLFICEKPSTLAYTVSNADQLYSIDVDTCSTTAIGTVQDASSGPIRKIRGLAYNQADAIMFGITREGDLVMVDIETAETTLFGSIAGITGGVEFWSGLEFEATSTTTHTLYTSNSHGQGGHQLVAISLAQPFNTPTATILGETLVSGQTVPKQVLGLAFYPDTAPLPTDPNPALGVLYAGNRSNDNIISVDTVTGEAYQPMANHTIGVTNVQAIAFHPETGVLYTLHDGARIATYDFNAEWATLQCVLPFNIVGGGTTSYGRGGLTFVQ